MLIVAGCSGGPTSTPGDTTAIPTLEELPAGTCGLELPADATSEDQVRTLIEAEGQLMAAREIGPLMALWAEESRVINARNTPDDEDDYQIWRGKDAIRHRYLNVVFPSAPHVVGTPSLDITVEGEDAWAQGTTQLNGERSPGGDQWQASRIGGCWQLMELIYNLEPLDPPANPTQ